MEDRWLEHSSRLIDGATVPTNGSQWPGVRIHQARRKAADGDPNPRSAKRALNWRSRPETAIYLRFANDR
ncbi:hypothetical protein BSFA1_76490 (plasmid) [Burkholderia sp. SFA1]|nr:hypothetical protein BSFA1_76490 [Burkholderia sp. SFA1]